MLKQKVQVGSIRLNNRHTVLAGKFLKKGLNLKFHLCRTLKIRIDIKRRIKWVQEGLQMFKNVKEERIPKGLSVIIDSHFG